MLLSSSKIEQLILATLQYGSVVTLDLVEQIRSLRPGTTKQGVYAALRSLKKKEIIVIGAMEVALNMSWLQRVNDFVEITQHHYGSRSGLGGVVSLRDRESVQYRFRDPIAADVFWNHTLLLLLETFNGNDPFIAYDPHVWFYLAHPENERHLRDEVVAHGRQYLVAAAYKTPLDRIIADEFNGETSQYHMLDKSVFEKSNYYLNILDDFLIEVWMDTIVNDRMEVFYRETKKLDETSRGTLRTILEHRGRMRLKVSRNKAKAERLRKRLLKGFYLKRVG